MAYERHQRIISFETEMFSDPIFLSPDRPASIVRMEPGRYSLQGKAAGIFRSICVARMDLRIAREMITHCLDDAEPDSDANHQEAYWTTALVRYSRAFADGQKVSWDCQRAMAFLSEDQRLCDKRLRMLRDKLIAHPVGIGEDMAVTATVGFDMMGTFKVYGVGIARRRISSLGTDEAHNFVALLDALLPIVERMEDEQHATLLAEIQTWPPETIEAGGLYQDSINYDDTSTIFRTALRKY